MEEKKSFPTWVQNAIGTILAAAIMGIGLDAWNDRAANARRDERIRYLESSFLEFRQPGERYTAEDGIRDRREINEDGIRDRREVNELKSEFYAFRDKGSRAAPQISQLRDQVNACLDATKKNHDNLLICKLFHNKVESHIYYILQLLEDDSAPSNRGK